MTWRRIRRRSAACPIWRWPRVTPDRLWLVGVNLAYTFNRHFSVEAGYNYDHLDSDINGRGYDRNRYYIGLRASY